MLLKSISWMTDDFVFCSSAVAGVNPERGSKVNKGTKRKHPAAMNGRVLKLINELKEFDSPWQL
jgi:hypothetical protein